MKKLLALALALVLALSLAACKKNTDGSSSNVSDAPAQGGQNETAISGEQPGESTPDGTAEPVSSDTVTDKNSTPSQTNPKQNTPTTPKQNTPAKDTNSNSNPTTTTQPAKPKKLNPKTDFPFGRYTATYFDNNNQSYHMVSLQFAKDFEGVEYIRDNYYTAEYLKKMAQQRGESFDENNIFHESKKTLNGITYYNVGDYDQLAEAYALTDTCIEIKAERDKTGELSLNPDGTLTLDVSVESRYGTVGTIFTRANG